MSSHLIKILYSSVGGEYSLVGEKQHLLTPGR